MVVPETCQIGIAAGMAALQAFYNLSTGLWDSTEWWNAANALEVTIDYSRITNTQTYTSNIFHTFERPKYKDFLNPWFNDDDGWWALTWIKAYDLTGNSRYLEQAKIIFQEMTTAWDDTCGGGLWWKKQDRTYKNAITAELFLTVAARLHLRSPGDQYYLNWAQRTWNWFRQTGMLNAQNLINDGLDSNCKSNQQTTWTYNQGVILGGLVDLHQATKQPELLKQAEAIADAAIRHLAPNGILQEPCEPDCGADGPQFKGIFMRNLSYLYATLPKPEYRAFILHNATTIWNQNRNAANQFGLRWAGSVDAVDAARQASAMDALNAAIALTTQTPYRSENRSGKSDHEEQMAFKVIAGCAGNYDLEFRYAAPAGAATRYIHVNGRSRVDNQLFPATPAATSQQPLTVPRIWLNAGQNTVSVIFEPFKGSQNPLRLTELKLR